MPGVNWKKLADQNKLYRWGIFPGRFFYLADFFDAAYHYFPSYSKARWPACLGLFVDEQMLLVLENEKLGLAGKVLFLQECLSPERRLLLIQACEKVYASLLQFLKSETFLVLDQLSVAELITFGQLLYQQIITFWLPTMQIELANYGGKWLLQRELKKRKVNPIRLLDLIAFEQPTFYQVEEANLLTTTHIEYHQKQYFWLQNTYHTTKVLPVEFFKERKACLLAYINQKTYVEHEQILAKKKERNQDLTAIKEINQWSANLSYGLWLQEERKQYILQLQHFKKLFLIAASYHLHQPWQQLQVFSLKEIITGLENSLIPVRNKRSLAINCRTNTLEFLAPQATKNHWYTLTQVPTKFDNVVQGNVVIPGCEALITGKVIYGNNSLNTENIDNAIVIASDFDPTKITYLKNAQALILDNWHDISHSVIAALAQLSFAHKSLCVLVLPGAKDILKLHVHITIHTNTGLITFPKELTICATVVSQGCVAAMNYEVVIDDEEAPIPLEHFKNKVVVLKYLTVDKVLHYRMAAALICENGSITCHGAIICRELGIPCMIGIPNAQTLLCHQPTINLDFKAGSILLLSAYPPDHTE